MADGNYAVFRREVRAVEPEIKGVYSPDVEATAVGADQVFADPGRVIRSPDPDEEQSLAGGYPGGELVHPRSVPLEDTDERFGLLEDGIVHVEWMSCALPYLHTGPSFWLQVLKGRVCRIKLGLSGCDLAAPSLVRARREWVRIGPGRIPLPK